MPKLNQLEYFKIPSGHYGFSGTRVELLGATEYTLVTIALDTSSSVSEFKKDLERTVRDIVTSCHQSPRADNLLIRLVAFSSKLKEIHGFKELYDCTPQDYENFIQTGGMTALYDATHNAVHAMSQYGKNLMSHDFDVNGILFVITDGVENQSSNTLTDVVQAFKDSTRKEHLGSLVSILVGVNVDDADLSGHLEQFKEQAGFHQYLEIQKAGADSLARLAKFVCESIGLQSKALGGGYQGNPLWPSP